MNRKEIIDLLKRVETDIRTCRQELEEEERLELIKKELEK